MGVCDEHCQQRLAEGDDAVTERPAVGDGEAAVHGHDAAVGLDEVRVDKRSFGACRVTVDANPRHHAAASVGRPWRATTRS